MKLYFENSDLFAACKKIWVYKFHNMDLQRLQPQQNLYSSHRISLSVTSQAKNNILISY